MLKLVLLQVGLASALASVVFEDCGSAYDLQAVNIFGCGMRLPCFVTLGENVPVNLRFRAGFTSRKLDQNVVININQVNLRTDVTPELCDSEQCLVSIDAQTSFNSVMTVPSHMALVSSLMGAKNLQAEPARFSTLEDLQREWSDGVVLLRDGSDTELLAEAAELIPSDLNHMTELNVYDPKIKQ